MAELNPSVAMTRSSDRPWLPGRPWLDVANVVVNQFVASACHVAPRSALYGIM